MLPVNISRIDPTLPLPAYQTPGSVAFDLAVREDAVIPPHGATLVPANCIIGVPEGHALLISARSSLHKRGLILANGVGVVDQDYRGPNDEVRLALLNTTDQPVRISRGDRLAQGFFVPVTRVTWHEIARAELASADRGGFGSTGLGTELHPPRD